MLDTKNTPPRRVLRVQRSPRPIFDVARRMSPLLVMLNTHFDVARRVNTLVVTSKPNPPYPGHGYGFWAGDPNSTRTRTRPTRTRLPARICKPVTNPSEVIPSLTFEASCWLLSYFVNVNPMAANGESVSNGPVSNVSVSNREDEMGSLLPRGLSLYG